MPLPIVPAPRTATVLIASGFKGNSIFKKTNPKSRRDSSLHDANASDFASFACGQEARAEDRGFTQNDKCHLQRLAFDGERNSVTSTDEEGRDVSPVRARPHAFVC